VEAGAAAGMKSDQLYLAGRQGMLSQRIAKDVNLFSQGGAEAAGPRPRNSVRTRSSSRKPSCGCAKKLPATVRCQAG